MLERELNKVIKGNLWIFVCVHLFVHILLLLVLITLIVVKHVIKLHYNNKHLNNMGMFGYVWCNDLQYLNIVIEFYHRISLSLWLWTRYLICKISGYLSGDTLKVEISVHTNFCTERNIIKTMSKMESKINTIFKKTILQCLF